MSVTGAGADLIVINGRVRTMDDDNPAAEAIAVKDGAIIAIGSRAAIEELKGPATKVIDAKGGSVLPGFIEAHMHLFSRRGRARASPAWRCPRLRGAAAGDPRLCIDTARGENAGRAGRRLHRARRRAGDAPSSRRHPAGPALLHGGARPSHDVGQHQGAGDGRHSAGHARLVRATRSSWARTAWPPANCARARPSVRCSTLPAKAACGWGCRPAASPTRCRRPHERAADRDIMRRGLAWCARHGITSIQNMDGNLYQLELLSEIEAEGGLPCRVKIPFHFKNFMTLDMLEKASVMAERYDSEWLSSGMVKVFYDGVLDSWTAVMVEPYADRPGLARRAAVHAGAIRRACRRDRQARPADRRALDRRWRGARRARRLRGGAEGQRQARQPPPGRAYRGDHRRRHAALRRTWRHRLDAAAASAGRHGLSAGADRIAHRPRPLAAELCAGAP